MGRAVIRRASASGLLGAGLIGFHAACAAMTLIRPDMVDQITGYQGFAQIMSTQGWGLWMALTALALATGKGQPFLNFAGQVSSVALLTCFAVLASAYWGPNWGTVAYTFPALASLLLMQETVTDWFLGRGWYRNLQCAVRELTGRRRLK